MTEKIFGKKSEFGIRYVPGWKSNDGQSYVAFLHLILAGQLIGDKDEICLVGTWMHYMENNLNLLVHDFNKLYHEEFENRTDIEVFEMIYKSNQLIEEHDPEFHYLPVLPNDVWTYCNINIDETIDAYLLTMIKQDNQIRFIWKGWREPCPIDRIDKLFATTSKREHVIRTIRECLEFVKNDLANYETIMTS